MTYDFAKAHAFFDTKIGFTTEPYELKARLDAGEALHVVDVRFPAARLHREWPTHGEDRRCHATRKAVLALGHAACDL